MNQPPLAPFAPSLEGPQTSGGGGGPAGAGRPIMRPSPVATMLAALLLAGARRWKVGSLRKPFPNRLKQPPVSAAPAAAAGSPLLFLGTSHAATAEAFRARAQGRPSGCSARASTPRSQTSPHEGGCDDDSSKHNSTTAQRSNRGRNSTRTVSAMNGALRLVVLHYSTLNQLTG